MARPKNKWDCEQERKKGELIRVQRKLGGSSNRNKLVNASYLCHWNFSHEGQWPTPICIKAACAIQPNVKWEPHSFIAWITQPKISPNFVLDRSWEWINSKLIKLKQCIRYNLRSSIIVYKDINDFFVTPYSLQSTYSLLTSTKIVWNKRYVLFPDVLHF